MSAHLLSIPEKMHTLQDDLESIFWVLLYTVMCYVGYNITLEDRLQTVEDIFFQYSHQNGKSQGGAGKRGFVSYCLSRFRIPDNVPLTKLLWGFEGIVAHFHDFMNRIVHQARNILLKDQNATIPDAIRTTSLKLADSLEQFEIRNHDAIENLFTNALSQKTWPKNDKAFDYFAKALSKRKLAEIEASKEGRKAAKRVKGNK